jgi:hypothetical protein
MKFEPDSMMRELEAGRTFRDGHLLNYDAQIRRYHQGDYAGFEECDFAPENHEGEYLSLMLAKLAFSEPRVRVRSMMVNAGHEEAIGLKHALNQWAVDTCLGETIQDVVRDYLFNWGVYYTTVDPMTSGSDSYADPDQAHLPRVHRLSQRQFVLDPLCGIFKHARWAAHEYAIEKDALIELAIQRPELGWNVAALVDLQPSQDMEWRPDIDDAPDREELRIARIWAPRHYEPDSPGPEDGYFGTIFTLIAGQEVEGIDDWVRKPIPFYGSARGPYQLAGAYAIPDSPWPLGPLTMVKGRVDELNAHAVSASKAMAEYKRLVLVSASHPELHQMMKRPDMFVIPVKGLNKENIVEVEVGGLKPEHLEALAVLRDRLDRASAMSDAKRGMTSGGTATENAIADEASSVRIAYLKQRHSAALANVYRTVADYFLRDDRIVFELGQEAAQELGMQEPVFVGGAASDPAAGIDPTKFTFTFEPYSMDYVEAGVAKQQFLEAVKVATELASMMPTMPHVKWKDIFTKMGDALNDEDWGDIVEPDIAAMMGGMPAALPATPQPQFASMATRGRPGGGGAGGGGGMGAPAGFQGGAGSNRGMTMQAAGRGGRMAGRTASRGRGMR